jgi:HlyD family secretion protein
MISNLAEKISKGFGNKRIKMIILLLATVLVVSFALTTYAKDKTSNDDATQFISVTRGDITEKISASGTVNAPTRVKLNFAPGSSGKLTLMDVEVGDAVKAGDVLAALDNRTVQTQLANAQANLDSALAKLNQTKQGATTETATLQQSNVEKARVALEGAKTAYANQLAIYNDRTQAYQSVTNAENQVVQAQIQLRSAQAGLDSAEARLDAARMGASNESLELARANVQASESQYDMAYKKYNTAQESLYQAQNLNLQPVNINELQIAVDLATSSLDQARIASANAKKQLADLQAGPSSSSIIQAEAAVKQAKAAVDQAENSYSASQNNLDLARTVYNDRNQATAQLDQVKNQMEQSQANYNSTVAQMNQALAPAARESIQMAEATVAQARIQVQQQQIALDNLVLRAPMDGVITQVNGKQGELVSASLPVVEINDSNTNIMHVMAEVSQNDIVKLRSGEPAEFTTTALLDQTFTGQVLVVYPEATTQNGITKYNVLLSVANSNRSLKSGLTVNVAIEVGSQSNVLYVPIQALRQLSGSDGVYIADTSQKNKSGLRFQPVTIGLFGGDIVEITSGLQEGDQVAVSNIEDSSSQGTPSIFGAKV